MNRHLNLDAPRSLQTEVDALQAKILEAYRVANAVGVLVGPSALDVQGLKSAISQAEEALWTLTLPRQLALPLGAAP